MASEGSMAILGPSVSSSDPVSSPSPTSVSSPDPPASKTRRKRRPPKIGVRKKARGQGLPPEKRAEILANARQFHSPYHLKSSVVPQVGQVDRCLAACAGDPSSDLFFWAEKFGLALAVEPELVAVRPRPWERQASRDRHTMVAFLAHYGGPNSKLPAWESKPASTGCMQSRPNMTARPFPRRKNLFLRDIEHDLEYEKKFMDEMCAPAETGETE